MVAIWSCFIVLTYHGLMAMYGIVDLGQQWWLMAPSHYLLQCWLTDTIFTNPWNYCLSINSCCHSQNIFLKVFLNDTYCSQGPISSNKLKAVLLRYWSWNVLVVCAVLQVGVFLWHLSVWLVLVRANWLHIPGTTVYKYTSQELLFNLAHKLSYFSAVLLWQGQVSLKYSQ